MAQSIWVFVPGSGVKAIREDIDAIEIYVERYPNLIYFYADLVPPNTEILTHEEDTLFKVYESLKARLDLTDQEAVECVSEMQNRGILFRERVKEV